MNSEPTLPRYPRRTEKYNIALADGSGEVLESMMGEAGFESLADYVRAIIEGEIQSKRPEDFARLRGVA